jgi:hypothetical protein
MRTMLKEILTVVVALGVALGAGIGSLSHARAGEGALIGGAVGLVGGYIVGNEMDKADQRRQQDMGSRSVRPAPAPEQAITRRQVIQWTQDGVRDDIIIDRIERSGTVFNLRAADENQLRDAGVSEAVIRAMRDTGR